MLKVAIFNTITGQSFDHIDNSQIIDDALVTLATGSEASTATIDIALNQAQASGWRNRFAKLDKSIAIYEERQTASGTVRDIHYAGFIDKVAAEGAANGGLVLSVRLSDPAELLKMIRISADKTYKAASWRGILKQLVADAFSQPNTPDVTIKGGLEPGEAVTFNAEAGSSGATYSGLIEEVKEASNGGYAEVAFTPKAQTSSGSLDAVTWEAEADSQLINLSKTVDVEDSENVYGFTIDSDSNSNFSRLVLKNAEGKSKTYTNPNGGTLLSDNVLEVDAAESDFDAIAAAYMKSEHLATSESHEVGVKMTLAAVRGVLGAVGVLPKAVEYSWSTSTRLRVVQAEYRIHMSSPASAESRAVVPVDLTFAPISNKTWVPPSRAAQDSLNQDWIDRNKYSGVGRDSYSGAHPGDYGGGTGGGGDVPGGGGGETPNPGGSGTDGTEGMDDFPKDPSWWAGSEGMENPEDAKGRAKPIYGFDISDPRAQQVAYQSQGLWPGPQDDPQWQKGFGVTIGQSHDGKKVYWSYWSSADARAWSKRALSYGQGHPTADLGVNLPCVAPGDPTNSPYKSIFSGLSNLKLVICEAELDKGEFKNARVISTLDATQEIQKHMSLDMFLVGTMGDYEKLVKLGISEDGLKKGGSPQADGLGINVSIRGIFTTDDRVILLYETGVIGEGWNAVFGVNSLRTITVRKGDDGDWEPTLGINSISNGGGVRFAENAQEEWIGKIFFEAAFRAGETWFGAINSDALLKEGQHASGMVFNVHSGNSIDPNSYNTIPGGVVEFYNEINYKRDLGFTVARGTRNTGMSLYYKGSHAPHYELELADGKVSSATRDQRWKKLLLTTKTDLQPFPMGAESWGFGGSDAVTVEGCALAAGWPSEGNSFALFYLTRIIPGKKGSSLSEGDRDKKVSSFDALSYTLADAGVPEVDPSDPNASKINQIREAKWAQKWCYYDGYLYGLVPGINVYKDRSDWNVDEGVFENYPFWWHSIKVTPRREPYIWTGSEVEAWKYAWNDVPINPAARPAGWTPGPDRYETRDL